MSTNKHVLIGSLIALISAATFALNMVLASVSYQHGANIHGLNFARAITFFCCLLLVVFTQRLSLKMTRAARLNTLVMGALLCSLMYALLGSVRTIPVAVAILIFYTYPILIALYRWKKGEDQFSIRALLLMIVAFVGLVIVLVDSSLELESTGVLFALAAAIIMAAMLILSEKSLAEYNTFVVMAHGLAVVTLLLLILKLTLVEHHWPQSNLGWSAFTASTLLYVIATFSLFKAVSLVGPLRTAIIDNTAPVWAMVFGYLVLQQTLSPFQLVGAITVIGAVMALQKSR